MMQGLASKIEAEGQNEELSYEKFAYWCKNSEASLRTAIAKEEETIEELKLSIEGKESEVETLTKQVNELEDEVDELEKAKTKAKRVRKDGQNLYNLVDGNLDDTIQGVKDALKALQEARTSTEGSAALVQLMKNLGGKITDVQRIALTSFLAAGPKKERPDFAAEGDRNASVDDYTFKSDKVIELLKELQIKFEEEKLASTKAETNAVNAFALEKKARQEQIDVAGESITAKTEQNTTVTGEITDARSELSNTQDDLKADSDRLEETEKSCRTKQSQWNERSAIREQEREAIAAAIKILAKVGDVRTEAPGNPVPPTSPVESFLQIDDPKFKAIKLLRESARQTHSKALERLAQEVQAHLTGPFDDVNNMIQKMIFRLEAEQTDEDKHKLWCDEEIEKTNTSKVNKEDKIDELTASIDAADAKAKKLGEDAVAANDMVSDIKKHVEEATEIRKIGKKENALAIKDSKDAQAALANAISVLEEFYKSTTMVPKEDWEFLQRAPVDLPDKPSSWENSYTGVTDPAQEDAGIITVLKRTASDFARMESDTVAQEQTDQDNYETDMNACSIEKARRTKESEEKTAEQKRQIEKSKSWQATRKHVESELEATEQYLSDLNPACVDGDSTYEDRKAARDKEIEALHQAQGILEDAFKEKDDKASAGKFFLRRSRPLAL